jgi:basic membrane lipoprotein Med (substrate-binding protein (PBP1-ABC) superfamily)
MFRRRRLLFAVLASAALAALLLSTGSASTASVGKASHTRATFVVGGIHVGSIKDAGYNEAAHDGLVYLQAHVPGVKVVEAENIPEGPNVKPVIQQMINQGARLIFTQSFGYQDFALQMAAKNPKVDFEQPAGYKQAANFADYWASSYELNYALGAAAAKVSKSGKLGFVGAIPIPQIIASSDAFQLGALSVNPKVTTTVVFTGSFTDPAKEAAAVNTMADAGVDVVGCLVDSPITVVKTAEQRGIWAIGYHSASAAAYAPNHWLSGVDFHWGPLFVQIAKSVMNGTWKTQNYLAPLSQGIARLAPFGKNVPASARAVANLDVKKFEAGELKSPFQGPVYDQSGKLRIKLGVVPSNNIANTITWLVKGMIGRPK